MVPQMVWRFTILGALVAALASAAPASAAVRYADDSADPASTTCTSLAPCPIDVAVNAASAVDEVVIRPGTYDVETPLDLTQPIRVHGDYAAERPVVRGVSALTAATLTVGARATVSHLRVEAFGELANAITLTTGATLDRVMAISATGFGIDAVSDPTPTLIRNTVAVTHTTRTGTGSAGLRISDGPDDGAAELRNVTAWAEGADATAIRCRTTTATTALVNTIARGGTYDVDAGRFNGKDPICPATTSNARTAKSPGFTPTFTTDPAFAGPASVDFRPLAGSQTIDRGTTATANGALDLEGDARAQGDSTDIGAIEFAAAAPPPPPGGGIENPEDPQGAPPGEEDPAPPVVEEPDGTENGESEQAAPGDDQTPATLKPHTPAAAPGTADPGAITPTTPATPTTPITPATEQQPLPPAAPPKLGQSVLLDAGKGAVLVKLPGTTRFVPLADAATLPLGTTIDATKGEVTLSTALPGGKEQSGTFSGGKFQVRQSKARGMTDIHLTGGDFGVCAAASSAKRKNGKVKAVAAGTGSGKKKPKSVRRLWGKDKNGRFRTHGKNSVATVRGTRWLTEDRCDGTRTTVTEGAVDVKPRRGGSTTRVVAGKSLLVRP